MGYIYKITNKINGKMYIGKTEYENPYKRWKQHINDSKKECNKNRALYRAFNKYGIENFIFEPIKSIDDSETLCEQEKYYIQFFNTYKNGYNLTLGGDGKAYLELDEEAICRDYYQTQNQDLLSKKYNCDVTTIRKILTRHKIPINTKGYKSLEKAVFQINNETGQIIAKYSSISEAERQMAQAFNIKPTRHIHQVCKGKRKTAYGYKWQYAT